VSAVLADPKAKPYSSRNLNDLLPEVREAALRHIELCSKEGIDLLVYCTYRNDAAQAVEYAKGRSAPGRITTNARPGESMHNWRAAYDCVPLINGKADWDSKRWPLIGQLGEDAGLAWAGRWSGKLKETAHFELPGGIAAAKQAFAPHVVALHMGG
jgi:peptidoglycan L-alanyl-D-glutamate endopeptidase CwlK